VLDHLWCRGEEELRLLGVTKEQAFDRMCGFAQSGLHAFCLEFDGAPVIVMGESVDDDGTSCTWFQATAGFDKHAFEITGFLLDELEKHSGLLRIYSVCVHKDTARWFRVLGFTKTDWQMVLPSGATLHRFERNLTCALAAAVAEANQ
jgi:hypothetical protein